VQYTGHIIGITFFNCFWSIYIYRNGKNSLHILAVRSIWSRK
jgi:hypothetical protein